MQKSDTSSCDGVFLPGIGPSLRPGQSERHYYGPGRRHGDREVHGWTTTTVVLTDATKTVDKKGLFGLENKRLSNTVLIPGLKVSVDGTVDEHGRVIAKKITTDGDDLASASSVEARAASMSSLATASAICCESLVVETISSVSMPFAP